MSQTTSFETIKTVVQTVSFVVSVSCNTLLIYLILSKSPKRIGSYKYLMIYFCCFAITFSVLDIIVQPLHGRELVTTVDLRNILKFLENNFLQISYILSVRPGFIVITWIADSFLGEYGELALLTSLCGCFGFILATIGIHFMFRYFALERKGKLQYFRGRYMVGWLTVPFFVGAIWGIVILYFCYPNDITMEYSKTFLKNNYGIELDKMTYIGAIYYVKNEKGQWGMNQFALTGIAIMLSIMGLSISVVLYFASKCYSAVKQLIYDGDSSYTKHLQQQLYKALVAQATIPLFFIFIPIGLYLALPLVGLECEAMGKIATFIYALYPALDPLPIIFIIDNYRIAIFDFFSCTTKNRVNVEPDEATAVSRQVV